MRETTKTIKETTLTIRLDGEIKAAVQAEAERRDCSMAFVVRDILRQALDVRPPGKRIRKIELAA